MSAPIAARQAFPRWSIEVAPKHQDCAVKARSATIIALPAGQARYRTVLTYPAAILVPDRREALPSSVEPPLSPAPILALLAPTALLGAVMLLRQWIV